MAKFHTLKIREIRKETPDCVSVALEVPSSLQASFAFIPGQYLTLKAQVNGEEVRRSYSICTSPSENDLRVAVKKLEGGKFSTFANEVLKSGDTIEVMPPMGNFHTQIDASRKKHYLAFAAGSGITPILSILKSVLETGVENRFTLFYGNRNVEHIIFKNELDALQKKYTDRLAVHHVLSRQKTENPILHGRIDGSKCHSICNELTDWKTVDEFFLCGPEEMIFSVKESLESMGVDGSKVHFELFTTAAAPEKPVAAAESAGSAISNVTITVDGDEHTFELAGSGQPVLDAAMDAGADVPFACKGGVCCTCKALVLEGKVEMDVNYALEPDEVEAGYVLTCQSHPKTERVVLSYDE